MLNVKKLNQNKSVSDANESSGNDSKKLNHVVTNLSESISSKVKKDNSSDSGCSSESEKTIETVENIPEKISIEKQDKDGLKRKLSDLATPASKMLKKDKAPNVCHFYF